MNFEKIVGDGFYSEKENDLLAYSYDSLQLSEKPMGVIWPKDTEEVRRIIFFANQNNIPVIPRGNGTNNNGATIYRQPSIIIDFSSRMNHIIKINLNEKFVEVEPGVVVDDLNILLKQEGFIFPIIPKKSSVVTIGGMIASNLISKNSLRYGNLNVWVSEIEFVDGTGKFFKSSDVDRFIGTEGCVVVFTKIRLKIKRIDNVKSYDIKSFDNLFELLRSLDLFKKDSEIEYLTFFDTQLSSFIGLKNYNLIIKYNSEKGFKKNFEEFVKIDQYDRIAEKYIAHKNYLLKEDVNIPENKIFDVINWAEINKVFVTGNILLGHLELFFDSEEKRHSFFTLVKHLNLKFYNGYGINKKMFVPNELKIKMMRLKEEYDYNNILNRSKVIDYK
ncbi:MAG: FAD-binding oxidoreductase [Candidatus Woesearchaeota archaeon]